LALRNFVEMRDKVGDPLFLLRKKMAAHLNEKYPEFLPSYSLVTFSNTPYHVALREDDRQNAFFEQLLQRPDIQQVWDQPAVEQAFLAWQNGL
jgi:kynurenine 3-monooxygenase